MYGSSNFLSSISVLNLIFGASSTKGSMVMTGMLTLLSGSKLVGTNGINSLNISVNGMSYLGIRGFFKGIDSRRSFGNSSD